MSSVITEGHILNKLKKLTVVNHLVNTIYVDENKGQIETTKTIKEYNVVRYIKESLNYKLKNHRIVHKSHSNGHKVIISDLTFGSTINPNQQICECISHNINRIFISEIDTFPSLQKHKFNFFKQGFLSKLLFPKSQSHLVSKILEVGKGSSWVLIPSKIYNLICNSTLFQGYDSKEHSLIHQVGKIGELNVLMNPDEKNMNLYFGNYDSITLLLNPNVVENDVISSSYNSNSKSYEVSYLFIETGVNKKLEIY